MRTRWDSPLLLGYTGPPIVEIPGEDGHAAEAAAATATCAAAAASSAAEGLEMAAPEYKQTEKTTEYAIGLTRPTWEDWR